jgi:predicted anti-sigma-YlaC factor YlaD
MNDLRVAPAVGIAGCLLYVVTLAVPYLLVETTSAVGAYYDAGALTPLVPATLALIALIVLAAGREGRSDPSIAAGAGIVLGLFVVGLSLFWAVTVPESLVLGLTKSTLMEHHRWAVVVAGLPVPAGAAWFAHALGLV